MSEWNKINLEILENIYKTLSDQTPIISQDSVDPLCSCGNDIESIVHFFLHCPNFTTQRQTLLNKLKSINASIMAENENSVVRTLLLGRSDFNYSTNK